MIRTLPVIGDLTTAEKYAAMPKTMQLTAKSSGIHWKKIAILAKTAPPTEPSTSIGRKMPPGTPEPKQIIVKRNLPTSSSTRKAIV